MVNVSIITITYNAYDALLRTIKSVRKNKKAYQSFYIIDGASTDDTLNLIKENLDIIDAYISEPDLGIYDAMNKVTRFNIPNDDYLIWINSGDELLNWNDSEIQHIKDFDCAFFAVNTKLNPSDEGKLIPPYFTLPFCEKNFISRLQMWHQGYFVKYSIFDSIRYSLNVGIQADRLLMYYTAKTYNYYLSSSPTANYYLDGISSTNHKLYHKSMILVAKKLKLNMYKLVLYNPLYFIKAMIKPYLPNSFYNFIRKYK